MYIVKIFFKNLRNLVKKRTTWRIVVMKLSKKYWFSNIWTCLIWLKKDNSNRLYRHELNSKFFNHGNLLRILQLCKLRRQTWGFKLWNHSLYEMMFSFSTMGHCDLKCCSRISKQEKILLSRADCNVILNKMYPLSISFQSMC